VCCRHGVSWNEQIKEAKRGAIACIPCAGSVPWGWRWKLARGKARQLRKESKSGHLTFNVFVGPVAGRACQAVRRAWPISSEPSGRYIRSQEDLTSCRLAACGLLELQCQLELRGSFRSAVSQFLECFFLWNLFPARL